MPVALPAVAAPMVRPLTMTVTAALAGIVAVLVVMMTWVLVDVATLPVTTPLSMKRTWGDPWFLKNCVGYVSVMLLPITSAPPAVVVNAKVAAAGVFHATRSVVAIENDVFVG